jgi:hypothetical protein
MPKFTTTTEEVLIQGRIVSIENHGSIVEIGVYDGNTTTAVYFDRRMWFHVLEAEVNEAGTVDFRNRTVTVHGEFPNQWIELD